jgi:hypothetical protein
MTVMGIPVILINAVRTGNLLVMRHVTTLAMRLVKKIPGALVKNKTLTLLPR